MSWARLGLVICAVAGLAGCSGSGGAGSSAQSHGLLPAGRVYHAVTMGGSQGDRAYVDDEWIDVDGGRVRAVQNDGKYHSTTVFDGRRGLTRYPTSRTGSLWHPLRPDALSSFYSSPVLAMLRAAVRGDRTVYGHPLLVARNGDGYTLRVDGPDHGDIVVKVVASITPTQADSRKLFTVDAPHPQQVVTQLSPGTRPQTGPAYWVGPVWRTHRATSADQTVSYRHGQQRAYTVHYGGDSADPWDVKGQIDALSVTTQPSRLPGLHPKNGGFSIQPVGGTTVTLADGTRATLLDDVATFTTVSAPKGADRSLIPDINSFLLVTGRTEIDVMGVFENADIKRIAGMLRPV